MENKNVSIAIHVLINCTSKINKTIRIVKNFVVTFITSLSHGPHYIKWNYEATIKSNKNNKKPIFYVYKKHTYIRE